MGTAIDIKGVPVRFPFQPYEIQKNYMEKVIECLQEGKNGILESPTGTGKTLSLLCSTLAWLEVKKAQIQLESRFTGPCREDEFLETLQTQPDNMKSNHLKSKTFLKMPTIIYASRTHSQLSQAMKELKRTSYNHMKAAIIGSREHLCIHPEIVKENNAALKIHMCRLKTKTKSCLFNNRNERMRRDPVITNLNIIDIEDIVELGQLHRFCPYYMSKELKQEADIVFMPYNYLLDPIIRKALGVGLSGNIIILDEAHNIEKMCEENASFQLKSSDIALCIEEVTAVMKALSDESECFSDQNVPFSAEQLCSLKQIFLDFENVLNEIPLNTNQNDLTTFDGTYIYEIFEKSGITMGNFHQVSNQLSNLVEFLATASEGPFQRKGNSLQHFRDLLDIAFIGIAEKLREKIRHCYKVYIHVEETKQKTANNWLSKATGKSAGRILNYWCFSPGFGMDMILRESIHCIILTSGTLAPLKPLISELHLNVDVQLENPHVIDDCQVSVNIVTTGPDGQILNSNYENRDNPKYISSLGNTIVNLIRFIPDGVLIFFPSYPTMQKCVDFWQQNGIWAQIIKIKAIFVEPRKKIEFNVAMTEYYKKIRDPTAKGAIFMGVCRGKVSEGLDFADVNGRAVFITGLPFPPLKDPKIILKKQYLDICNVKDREYLKGNDWYTLEATRAVNQAIGRVIRHRYDYGAIILLDKRFNDTRIKSQLSLWLRNQIKTRHRFSEILIDIRDFFKNVKQNIPEPDNKIDKKTEEPALNKLKIEAIPGQIQHHKNDVNFVCDPSCSSSTNVVTIDKRKPTTTNYQSSDPSCSSSSNLVNIYKRKPTSNFQSIWKKKKLYELKLEPNPENVTPPTTEEFIGAVKKMLDKQSFQELIKAMSDYKEDDDLNKLTSYLDKIFVKQNKRYTIIGLEPYIKTQHKEAFKVYFKNLL